MWAEVLWVLAWLLQVVIVLGVIAALVLSIMAVWDLMSGDYPGDFL